MVDGPRVRLYARLDGDVDGKEKHRTTVQHRAIEML